MSEVQREIAKLDAINRERSLTADESDRLYELIRIERHTSRRIMGQVGGPRLNARGRNR